MSALSVIDKHIREHAEHFANGHTQTAKWLHEFAVKVLQTVRVDVELDQLRSSVDSAKDYDAKRELFRDTV